ncbi:MAG: hypothetical protein M3Z36_14070 [Acidobacteriota bacterium]|nr:hypothetical protein [Acidobacteriota bacterium]
MAAVTNRIGKGQTLLIGSFPGSGYYLHHSPEAKAFFAGLLDWAKVDRQVKCSDPKLQARLHVGEGGTYLWVVNPNRDLHSVNVTLASTLPAFAAGEDVWGGQKVTVRGREVTTQVADRDVAVIRLR